MGRSVLLVYATPSGSSELQGKVNEWQKDSWSWRRWTWRRREMDTTDAAEEEGAWAASPNDWAIRGGGRALGR